MTRNLSSCIDPRKVGKPAPPPMDPPKLLLSRAEVLADVMNRPSTPPWYDQMVRGGYLPPGSLSPIPEDERADMWLEQASALGAVRLK
jgi:hypothetical protein